MVDLDLDDVPQLNTDKYNKGKSLKVVKFRRFLIIAVITVGVNKNCTLVFLNFSAQDASILKISVTIIKRRS